MQKIIKPGCVVRDKYAAINYGLIMNVIDDNTHQFMVSYINLEGNYKEEWLNKEVLELIENPVQLLSNPLHILPSKQ